MRRPARPRSRACKLERQVCVHLVPLDHVQSLTQSLRWKRTRDTQAAPAPCGGGTGRWRNSCPPSFWPRVTHYTERPPCCEALGAPGGREGQCPGRRGGDTGPGRGAGMGAFPPVSGAVPLRVGTPPGPCWGDDEKAVSPHEAVRPRSSEPCACGRACGWGAGRVSAERWRFRAPRGLRESARDWPRRVRSAPPGARPSENQRSHGVRPTSGACGRGPWLHGCRAPPPDTVKARAAPSCARRAAAGGGGGDGARASAFPCWPPREGLQREAAQPGLGAPGRAAASRQPGVPGTGSLPPGTFELTVSWDFTLKRTSARAAANPEPGDPAHDRLPVHAPRLPRAPPTCPCSPRSCRDRGLRQGPGHCHHPRAARPPEPRLAAAPGRLSPAVVRVSVLFFRWLLRFVSQPAGE